jgi:hypothetical protein
LVVKKFNMKPIKIKLTKKEKQRIIELLIENDYSNELYSEKFDTLCAFNRIQYSILNKDK